MVTLPALASHCGAYKSDRVPVGTNPSPAASTISMWHHRGLSRMRLIGWPARIGIVATIAALSASALSGQRAGQPVRTPDSQPDLQGVWRVHTITPLERPAEFVDRPFLTPQEASAFQARLLAGLNLDTSPVRAGLNGPSVNEFWAGDRGELAVVAGRIPTSLVVDPADGRH